VKPVVLALNAQFGVGAWGKRCSSNACVLRAIPNGMGNPTLFTWRPVLVRDCSGMRVLADPVRIRREPVLRCVGNQDFDEVLPGRKPETVFT
jgi:hypothetical protein